MSQVDLHKLVDQLHVEGFVRDRALAERALNQMDFAQPWYVRTMVGFGAWLASLMLISFIVGLSVAFNGGYFVIGGVMVLAGCYARRKTDSDFMVQASLAAGLSGQALIAYGLSEMLGHDVESREFLLATFFTSGFMFWIFPDRTLRVLEALFMTTAAVILIYVWELKALIPLLGPLLAAAMVYLQQTEARWVVRNRGEQARAAMTGLMLGAFGCVLLSAVYLLPELGDDLEIYPRPWLSTLLLGGLLLDLGRRLWPQVFGENSAAAMAGYALMLAVIAAAWVNPGLILALIVIILGANSSSRALTGAGIGFLAVFTAMYFYGIEVSLLTKSITLVTTGIIILFSRWLILKLAGTDADSERAHA
jgi:hypothetical protein